MILLDSSVIIELFRKPIKENTLFYQLSQTENVFAISTITYYEIGIGNRASHYDYWKKLTNTLKILSFDKNCSVIAIKIYKDLIRKNKIIDLTDILKGSTAIANDLPIATLNKKHFKRINGLLIV